MPQGMLLRSPYVASNIADPERVADARRIPEPTRTQHLAASRSGSTASSTTDAGFSSSASPELDRAPGGAASSRTGRFSLELADGDRLRAARRRGGGRHHAVRLPAEGVRRPAARAGFALVRAPRHGAVRRQGRGGRSAAARVRSNRQRCCTRTAPGSRCSCAPRASTTCVARKGLLHRLGPLTDLLFAPAEVGPAGVSRLVSMPNWYRAPAALGCRTASRCARCVRPAPPGWSRGWSRFRSRSRRRWRRASASATAGRAHACRRITADLRPRAAGDRLPGRHLSATRSCRPHCSAASRAPAATRGCGVGFESSVPGLALPRRAVGVELRPADAVRRRHRVRCAGAEPGDRPPGLSRRIGAGLLDIARPLPASGRTATPGGGGRAGIRLPRAGTRAQPGPTWYSGVGADWGRRPARGRLALRRAGCRCAEPTTRTRCSSPAGLAERRGARRLGALSDQRRGRGAGRPSTTRRLRSAATR